ncbi:MAG: cobalt-precorrin-5B (C(1))-methyltransferase CbiD [Candidatus Faecousia sp.]|nr:cobalt-precorrin-5B (C(1))-methyltransferase CbiD [Bacillota bacterium]MDY4220736.1 cobalt-precorrin-5B (C(1))-methyltransferase CbiD [Candidatus Faecousia sp.]
MGKLSHYIPVGKEKLRCGYTTGTCAAAAAGGAAERLLSGVWPDTLRILTPAGIPVEAEPEAREAGPDWAFCGVRKDGGDDPDQTDGILVCARVRRLETPGIVIDGGEGVGRVTLPGLNQPVGAAAINDVPRQMIRRQLEEALARHGALCGLEAIISVPGGEALARKTFNPRLGIQGGISILGTSGIVRPMSEEALIQSLYLEQDSLYARGVRDLLVTPGNYGEDFSREVLGLRLNKWALCSNYVGAAIDHAAGLGFHSFLLVGHLGKLVKVAGGAMNTHSKTADGRRETLAAHTAMAGGSRALVQKVFDSPTTDAAVAALREAELHEPVLASIAVALEENLRHRAGEMEIGALFFSNQYGILGKTPGADRLLSLHR